jgi:hypothetical protein
MILIIPNKMIEPNQIFEKQISINKPKGSKTYYLLYLGYTLAGAPCLYST